MSFRRPYTPPAIRDVARQTKPVWVRVGNFAALISYPTKRPRRGSGVPDVPTWLVLGPMPEGRTIRPTVASGRVKLIETGELELEQLDGELPEEMRPALLEAAHNLVWAREGRAE